MELIVGVIVAFFLGGVAGWLLRSTRDEKPAEQKPVRPTRRTGATYRLAAGGKTARDTEDTGWTSTREPGTEAPRPRPGTVLLADDRMEQVALNRAHLELHGYRVLTASDGDSALALARKEHPAVVVLDHSMPGRNGIEVTRALKADPATADIVVLLMTAHSYGAIGASARAAGASGFMSKPCTPSRVLREVAVYAGPTS